jgi:uncharacterized protein YbjT (DUF2867 family)
LFLFPLTQRPFLKLNCKNYFFYLKYILYSQLLKLDNVIEILT